MELSSIRGVAFNGVLKDTVKSVKTELNQMPLPQLLNKYSSNTFKHQEEKINKYCKISETIDKQIMDFAEQGDLLNDLDYFDTDIFILNNGLKKRIFLLHASENEYEDAYIPIDENFNFYGQVIDISKPPIIIKNKLKKFFDRIKYYSASSVAPIKPDIDLTCTKAGKSLYKIAEEETTKLLSGKANNEMDKIFAFKPNRRFSHGEEDFPE